MSAMLIGGRHPGFYLLTGNQTLDILVDNDQVSFKWAGKINFYVQIFFLHYKVFLCLNIINKKKVMQGRILCKPTPISKKTLF